ncbi:hypothetical protein RYX36_011186, partial [Vicia faba]
RLREEFQKFGEVIHAGVVIDRVLKALKVYGLYATLEDPAKGIEGMDGKRPGYRFGHCRYCKARVGIQHRVTKEDSIKWFQVKYEDPCCWLDEELSGEFCRFNLHLIAEYKAVKSPKQIISVASVSFSEDFTSSLENCWKR